MLFLNVQARAISGKDWYMSTSIPVNTLEKFTTFGDLLRFLRRRAGITQLELSIAVGYSDSQISRLEQNLRPPDLATIQARFVAALDLKNEPEAVARLLELAANVRREDAPAPGLCPYKGLSYFDEADADLFIGREALTAELVERILGLALGGKPDAPKFLAIVGASGSGKSSLVRAGMVPALRWNKKSADWLIHVITPAAHPLESLATSLAASVAATATLIDDLTRDRRSLHLFARREFVSGNGSHLLLVVDQFEELFALCRSEDERASFVDNLLTAASEADGRVVVIITLRADFYAHCAGYAELREALAGQQEYIGAMSDAELRRAIEEPARRGRWEFEPGLVDVLLHDVGHEPGALPLLSHALLETWQRRRGRTMTHGGYVSSGGVRGAIAETAEAVFTDQFNHEQQAIARRIFMRLTELGDESAAGDTRRRATFNELILVPEEATATQAVLKALADARLITTSEDAAEVAHEALIREWPTLHAWLEEDREGLRLHRGLTEAAQEWVAMDHEPDVLYRGARLAQVREWAAAHPDETNPSEREFLEASQAWADRAAAEREAQLQRELVAAQELAETQTRAAKQLRRGAIFLTGAFALAIILAGVALFLGNQANRNATQAQTNALAAQQNAEQADASAKQAESEQRVSLSRELAAAAISSLVDDPERSLLLALQAESTADTIEAQNALHRSILASRVLLVLHHDAQIWSVTYSPDGRRIATASQDKTAKIWDATTGQLLLTLTGHADSVNGIVYSPDGKRIATTSDDHTAKVWDASTGEELLTFSNHTAWVARLAFSPDGKRLVTTSGDMTARVWDAGTGEELLKLSGGGAVLFDVAFSPDGKRIATSGQDGNVRVWDSASGEELLTLPVEGGTDMRGIAFSPDGTRVALASDGNYPVTMWDASTGEVLLETHLGHSHTDDFPVDIAFSPDGRLAATAGGDEPSAKVWDPITGEVLYTLSGHTSGIAGVAFSPDGTRLATASWDGTARVWDISPARELLFLPRDLAAENRGDDQTFEVRYSPDGTRILTDYPKTDSAKLWDAVSGKELLTIVGHADHLAYSPDGKMVAASNGDTINVFDARTGKQLLTLVGHTDHISGIDFSGDGTRLASAGFDGTVRTWDLATGKTLLTLQEPGNVFLSVAYSPDGKRMAAGFGWGTGFIWDAITGEKLFTLSAENVAIFGAAFSPDGKRLALTNRIGTVGIWDAVTGKQLMSLRANNRKVNAVTFSPNGKLIATAGDDGTARVWDATSGVNLLTLPVDGGAAGSVSFSPDGKRLAVGGMSGVQLFVLPVGDVVALAKSRLTRTLTEAECQQYLHVEACPPAP